MNEWTNEWSFISSRVWWGWLDLYQKYAKKPKNKIIEKETEMQKRIYSAKPKITWFSYLQWKAWLHKKI